MDGLGIMIKYKAELTHSKVLSATDSQLIFGSVSILYSLHQKLFTEVNAAIQAQPESPVIAPALSSFIPYLKMYTQYANSFEASGNRLAELNAQPAFQAAIGKLNFGKHHGYFGLKNLTITPIQRVPRYRLLIHELLKRTSDDDSDRDIVKDVLRTVSDVARHLDEKKQERRDLNVLAHLSSSLSGSFASLNNPELFAASKSSKRHTFRKCDSNASEECMFCRLSMAIERNGYVCQGCKYRVHEKCYSSAPPNCSSSLVSHPVSVLKVGRKIVADFPFCLYKKYGMLDSQSEEEVWKLARLLVFSDATLIVSNEPESSPKSLNDSSPMIFNLVSTMRGRSKSTQEEKVELIDMVYHYGRGQFAGIEDVFCYGSSMILSNPMSELKHVLLFQSMNAKFQVMGKIQESLAKWSHENWATIARNVATISDWDLEVSAEKSSHHLQMSEYQLRIGFESGSVLKKFKDLQLMHASLQKVLDPKRLPPFPDKKLFLRPKDEGKQGAAESSVYLNALIVLPQILSFAEVESFFAQSEDPTSGNLFERMKRKQMTVSGLARAPSASGIDGKLSTILDSALSLIFFRKYLESINEHHNVDFYLQVQELRTLRGLGKIKSKSQSIYNEFILQDIEREFSLPLSEKILEDLAEVFSVESQVMSFASVFNAAADMIHQHILINLFPGFLESDSYSDMMKEADMEDVQLKSVNSYTMLKTLVSHLKLRPLFQTFLASKFCAELLYGWIRLEEGFQALNNCRNIHLQRKKAPGNLLGNNSSLNVFSGGKQMVGEGFSEISPRATAQVPMGLPAEGLPRISFGGESGVFREIDFPLLPDPDVPQRTAVKQLMRYFQRFNEVFVDPNAEMSISFDLARREAFVEWLENLTYVTDLSAERNERVLIEMRSDMEVYLSTYIVDFVDSFEKKRLDSLKSVSSATIRKASLHQGIPLPEAKGHRKKQSTGSGGIFGTLLRALSPRPGAERDSGAEAKKGSLSDPASEQNPPSPGRESQEEGNESSPRLPPSRRHTGQYDHL